MEARLKVWKSGDWWWWELKTHNTAMMTPDRYVDGGDSGTWNGAWGDAELAWMHFSRSLEDNAA